MDTTRTTHNPSCAYGADVAAARAHLKESWEYGKEAARDAGRVARKNIRDLARGADDYVESRPRTIVFWALGTGLAMGLLISLLVRRAVRASPAT